MNGRIEARIEREIRQAAERGDFANLPGAGKPLPDAGQPLAEDWWLRDKIRRENIGVDGLPTTLRLRKQAETIDAKVAALRTETAVRDEVEILNKQIRSARMGPVDGPPVLLKLVDVDAVVARWRAARG